MGTPAGTTPTMDPACTESSGTGIPEISSDTPPSVVGNLPFSSTVADTGSAGPMQAPLNRTNSPGARASGGSGGFLLNGSGNGAFTGTSDGAALCTARFSARNGVGISLAAAAAGCAFQMTPVAESAMYSTPAASNASPAGLCRCACPSAVMLQLALVRWTMPLALSAT